MIRQRVVCEGRTLMEMVSGCVPRRKDLIEFNGWYKVDKVAWARYMPTDPTDPLTQWTVTIFVKPWK